jgi:hypothetical protein
MKTSTLRVFAGLATLMCSVAIAAPVRTEDEAINIATAAIHKFRLTTLKDECGAIDVFDKRSYFEVVVRERHVAECGGAAETAPRLFSIRVRKRDGLLTSDVYDDTHFKPLDHVPTRPK